jgi:hypothetical protein
VTIKKSRVWVAALAATLLLVAGALVARKIIDRLRRPHSSSAPTSTGPRVGAPLAAAEMLYDGKLSPGWEDWGWGPHQLGNGPAKIVFASYGGVLLHHDELSWRYGGMSFRYKAPSAWGDFLQVALRHAGKADDAFPVVSVEDRHVAAVEGGWKEVLVDWKELNPDRLPFDRVLIGSRTTVGPEWAELDRVLLTKAPAQDTRQGTLAVLCDGATHPISELIYGGSTDEWGSGQSAQRIGGNPLSRANWEIGAWNTGSDWYFENVAQRGSLLDLLDHSSRDKRKIAIVVPMLGWIAKDKTSFGFPRAKFGAQRAHDPYKAEAGDGFAPDGTPIRPGDPSETSLPAPPELIKSWIERVLAQDVKNGSRAIHMYILDNEPTLWNVTHRDVHPDPLSYDELLDRTIRYATAIRDADPDAVIAGPTEWGWTGYQYSALDRDGGFDIRPDRRAHGDVPLVAWYLKKLAEHEQATGKRLLDVFDLHFYPAANGLYGSNAGTDPSTADLRMRSTRGLWDPDYMDESWIKEKLQLIPRMKEWVRASFPGRKLSLGEGSFGAEEHISGGLAIAEALGRFGQQGLDAAFHWGNLKDGTPAYWAFRAFRDFDGQGGRFQDVSLPTRELEKISLFASRDPAATRLVLVVVNQDQTLRASAQIALRGCGGVVSARRLSYGPGSSKLEPEPAELSANGVSVSLEPFSFSVIELRLDKANKP